MAGVTLEHLTKTFCHRREEICAVNDLNLSIADGELMVLVGPSGCGKTTTLRLIAGLDEPSSGTIRIGDRVVNRVTPKDRDVAMVFQNLALYPHKTAFDNMAFGLKMRGVPRADIERKVQDAASMLGIGSLLTRRPAALSGGERQRVALGRAIVREPKVFLFDEPLSSLDANTRGQMRTEIKSLHQVLRATIIHVTHDQEEAMILGDRIAVLRDGKLQQVGTPLELYRRPANRFVAGFIGTPSMNFIDGTIERDDGHAAFISPVVRLAVSDVMPDAKNSETPSVLILGVRPEHIVMERSRHQDREESQGMDAAARQAGHELSEPIDARVRFTEHLGDRAYVHLVGPGEHDLIARVSGTALPRTGESVTLRINLTEAHWFKGDESGRRL